MGVQSMTGFGRAQAVGETSTVLWELKSVNGKGLEIRLRLPPGLERIEQPARQAVSRRFSRGNVQASLTVTRTGLVALPVVNETFLRDVAGLAQRLQDQFGLAPASADGLLALRGVLEIPDPVEDEESRAAFDATVLSALEQALDQLAAARADEGAALEPVLRDHLGEIETLVARAETDPSREPAAIRARLAEQVRLLLDAAPPLDEARLHQEAAFLAAKADIREEIDRLKAHVAAARTQLETGGAVGRKLDFLAQEFNRESNTLCSKSNAAAVTAIGLELKAVVDRFREQVQNLE